MCAASTDGFCRSEPPVETQNRKDALLLAELLGVGAAVPLVARKVLAVGHVLHAAEDIQLPSAHGEGAVHPDIDAAVVGRASGVHLREVVYAPPLLRGHHLVVRRERPA